MGVLAHAVGSWVLVERLSTPAASQDGKCLGLLPALLGRSAQQRVQQQQIQADSPKRKSPALQRQQRGTQLLQQCAAAAHAPRISVLRHPIVGAAIAFAIDTTARLAATISTADSAACCGGQTSRWLGLCLWKAEGGGELLGAARLPRAYGEADDGLRLNRQSAALGFPERDAEDWRPGVLFCGSDLVVTAGGVEGGRIDVWRVSDFLPPSKYFGNSQRSGEAVAEAGKMGNATTTGGPLGAEGLQLQFQHAKQPKRLLADPLENYTTACLTRRAKGSPRLLLVASDRGWVYAYDFEANVFVFELFLGDFPISSITCGKAMYLAYSTGSFARRATVDLIRVLEMWAAMGPTGSGGSKSGRSQHSSRGTENKGEGDSPMIATADSGGSLRLWSRWPLPQQLAEFSLPHPCTALAFLWRTLLLGCFKDGSLRLFDTNAFRLVGRLQLATTQDPPVAIACLGAVQLTT
ncbi:WD domain, G-beta repeat-containing protein, putative [Eimeria mitis]|uniref:WD domain, G-beta repeat-containing protein, putative n=1 Tax=Eimeria mitis TaxID=44415 RepID=U6K787_9EIME|nr:WD domain, G-beta repeat-containing protein, putative [Eimeria mitis]CDJ32077.1 WD domain, G-beta repeat-containing protein, putative [Eimeria mitis]